LTLGNAVAEELPDGFRIGGYEWESGPFTSGEVEALNAYGDIRSRASDDGRVHLAAAIQKFSPEHDRFDFRLTEGDGRLRVEVTLPPAVALGKARGDLAVLVPPGVRLSAATEAGSLVVNRFQSPLRGRTLSGKIKVDSPQPVDLWSESGAISARLTGTGRVLDGGAGSSIQTGSGPVELTLADDVQLELWNKGSGEMDMDCTHFRTGCRIERNDATLLVHIGEGGLPLRIRSGGGAIRIGSEAVVRPPPARN
jgi:hypothetical protein